jgi:hypothetical protein
MSDDSTKTEKLEKDNNPGHLRLPCRGCTETCANRYVCEGKLWRLETDIINNDTYMLISES